MEIKLPFLTEQSHEAMVTFWLLDEGDRVEKEMDLVEMSTSKAVFKVPSPVGGILRQIVAREGEVVPVGGVLAIIEEDPD